MIDEVKEVMGSLATGNLTRKIARDYQGSYGALKTDINNTVDKLVQMVTEIRETAEKVKHGTTRFCARFPT